MARSTTASPNSQIASSHSDASYEKDYLLGKYGATPYYKKRLLRQQNADLLQF